MATLTFQHSNYNDGQVIVEFDVSDVNWRVSQVRCINNSDEPAHARVLESGVPIFTAVAPANQTTTWNTTGIRLGWDSVDGGLQMGVYELHTAHPWSAV